MKVLTVRQPWAWAIARGFKNIENRTRITHHRGPLAIHAGKQWDDGGEEALRQVVHIARAQGHALPPTLRDDLPYSDIGLVLAVVDVVGVCAESRNSLVVCECGPWARPWSVHWQLANARRLVVPFPARGREYLWDLDFEPDFEKERTS